MRLEALATAIVATGIRSSACQYSKQTYLIRVARTSVATSLRTPPIL
jgi:hypothetical protein